MEQTAYQNQVINEGAENFCAAMAELKRPSAIHKPRLYIDGDMWFALYGANLQEGVYGYGPSPAAAMKSFDASWVRNVKN